MLAVLANVLPYRFSQVRFAAPYQKTRLVRVVGVFSITFPVLLESKARIGTALGFGDDAAEATDEPSANSAQPEDRSELPISFSYVKIPLI